MRYLPYLADKLAAKPSKSEDMKERHNEGDDSLRVEHAAKALGLLKQVGNDIFVCELHALHQTRSTGTEAYKRQLMCSSTWGQLRGLKVRGAVL